MGNSKARISERITKPNKKPRRKDGPQHQHLLSFQHEERLRQFLLQQQMERRLDGPQQEPRQPVQGVQELVQQGGGRGGGGQHQDGGQDRRLRVQAGGVEGLRASGRLLVEGRHEEKKEDGSGYIQRSFSRRYTLPKEAEADKMVSNLSSEGILVITTPKSAPALTDATHEAK